MGKIILVCLLFYSVVSISQIKYDESQSNFSLNEKNSNFKSSYSVYFTSGFFIPVRLNEEKNTGIDYNFGFQNNTPDTMSLCLDIDLAFTKQTYLQIQFSPRYYFPISKNFKLFVGPKVGIFLYTTDEGKLSLSFLTILPLSISFDAGMQYKINNNFSFLFKITNNPRIESGYNTSRFGYYIFANGGIVYQF